MQPLLRHLLDLQNLDIRLAAVRARLASLPKRLGEVDARIASARSELDKAKTAQSATLKDRKKYELDVEQWKEKLRRYKDQTLEVKTNEAYRALLHELQLAESEIAKAEDRLLEQMVAGEEYERRIKSAERSVREIEEVARAERAVISGEEAAAKSELAALEEQRRTLRSNIPEDLLEHYQRIAKRHDGIALAEVRDETCTMCGVRIRPHVFQEMRRPENPDVFHCETCTRMLYYVEPPPAASAPQNSAGPGNSASAARSGEA